MTGRVLRGSLAVALLSTAAAPAAAADADTETDADEARAFSPATLEAPQRHFSFKVALAGAYRRLYAIPVYGIGGQLQLGGSGRLVSAYGICQWLRARTEAGLDVSVVHVAGGVVEWHLDPLRLGIGGNLGWMTVRRVTNGQPMGDVSATLRLLVSSDLVKLSQADALYAEADLEFDVNGTWGPTLLLGYRWW